MSGAPRGNARAGQAPISSYEDANMERREWQRKVAMETIDLSKDPYFLKNHLGSYECRLCLTLHMNEGSYLAHTQGKKHQTNLARRAAREAKETVVMPQPKIRHTNKRIVKIGRPGYKVIKQRDPESLQKSLYFELDYAEIDPEFLPKHRIMSAFEQKLEVPDKNYQYLLFAADPYETVAFKIPNKEIDKDQTKFYQYWDKEKKTYYLQIYFKERNQSSKNQPALPQKPSQFNPIGARF